MQITFRMGGKGKPEKLGRSLNKGKKDDSNRFDGSDGPKLDRHFRAGYFKVQARKVCQNRSECVQETERRAEM